MEAWKQAVVLISLAALALLFVCAARGADGGDGLALRKLLYSIRKQTLASLNQYSPPSRQDRRIVYEACGRLVESIEDAQVTATKDQFERIGFVVDLFQEKGERIALLHENENKLHGGGIYLFKKFENDRCKVLMAPHGFFDVNTSRISVEAFFETGAHALLLNSAHRFTGDREARSDRYGTDFAHRADNYYFAVFQALADRCQKGAFIQLHGFEPDSGRAQSEQTFDVIVSGGDDAGPRLKAGKRAAAIVREAFPDLKVAVYGIEVKAALGGETNVHNRYLRKKEKIAFVHIEMDKELRKRLAEGKDDARRFYKLLDKLFEADLTP